MPTYEFRCPDGTVIERMFKISEVPETIPMPDGNGVATRMISGGAALLFKGSGFYITDYGKDGKKDQRAASNAAEGAGSGGGKAEGKGDSKAATPAAPSAAPSSSTSSSTSSSGEK